MDSFYLPEPPSVNTTWRRGDIKPYLEHNARVVPVAQLEAALRFLAPDFSQDQRPVIAILHKDQDRPGKPELIFVSDWDKEIHTWADPTTSLRRAALETWASALLDSNETELLVFKIQQQHWQRLSHWALGTTYAEYETLLKTCSPITEHEPSPPTTPVPLDFD